jgi:hypothetical protein
MAEYAFYKSVPQNINSDCTFIMWVKDVSSFPITLWNCNEDLHTFQDTSGAGIIWQDTSGAERKIQG